MHPSSKLHGDVQTCGTGGSPEVTLSYSFFDLLLFRCLYLEKHQKGNSTVTNRYKNKL